MKWYVWLIIILVAVFAFRMYNKKQDEKKASSSVTSCACESAIPAANPTIPIPSGSMSSINQQPRPVRPTSTNGVTTSGRPYLAVPSRN